MPENLRDAGVPASGSSPSSGTHQRPLVPGTDERNDLLHQRIVGKLTRLPLNLIAKYAVAKKQRAKGAAQLVQLPPRNAAASQVDDIKPSSVAC